MAIGTNADAVNYCPFNCHESELEEHGYCCHLIGFTNDGKIMEPITYNEKGQIAVRGRKRDRQEVQKNDRRVNPVLTSRDPRSGMAVDYFKWVSDRVYRRCTEQEKQVWIARRVDADFEESEEAETAAAL